jgi:hypothetical protein
VVGADVSVTSLLVGTSSAIVKGVNVIKKCMLIMW